MGDQIEEVLETGNQVPVDQFGEDQIEAWDQTESGNQRDLRGSN